MNQTNRCSLVRSE